MITLLILFGLCAMLVGFLGVMAAASMPIPNGAENVPAIIFLIGLSLLILTAIFHSHIPSLGHFLGMVP